MVGETNRQVVPVVPPNDDGVCCVQRELGLVFDEEHSGCFLDVRENVVGCFKVESYLHLGPDGHSCTLAQGTNCRRPRGRDNGMNNGMNFLTAINRTVCLCTAAEQKSA
jgi:hypothetical protein